MQRFIGSGYYGDNNEPGVADPEIVVEVSNRNITIPINGALTLKTVGE
jgi:hypothetical protein